MRALDASSLITITDADGIIIDVNQKFCETSEYARDELLGQDHRIVNSGYHSKEFMHELWHTVNRGEVWHGDIRNRKKSGAVFWTQTIIVPFLDKNQKPYQFYAIRHDITAQRESDNRLRDHALLLDKARDAIQVRSLDQRILYWNDSCIRLYGYSREEAIGRSTRELLYEDPEIFDRAIAELFEKKEFTGALPQVTKDKRSLLVQMHWTLVSPADGTSELVFCINSDITEKHKLEQQLLRSQRLESIGTLAGGIAHDLNNILTPILLAVEVLKTSTLSPDQRELIDTIALSGRRGAGIIKQVLSFARGVDGNRVPMHLDKLLKDIEKIIKETFPKNIRLTFKLPQELWLIQGDETQLHQVVMNLVVNARDAMPHGGELLIVAENQTLDAQYAGMFQEISPGKFVVVRVEDSGQGMSTEVIDRIFEPFFTTKSPDKGTGLGLSTSIGIVKAHGGIIRIYSELQKGSRFHVYLPAWQSEEEIVAEKILSTIPHGNGEKILVVDDELLIRNVTRQTLEANGYRVATAQDGAEAIAIYAEQRDEIKLILTDMMMPVMDGLGTIKVIRKMNPVLPIVVMSGLDANSRLTQLSGDGIKYFLPKPYSADLLLKTIYQALHEPSKNTESEGR